MTSNSPIRVAFGLDSFGLGGSELNAVRTAEKLDRDRFELTALVLRREGPLEQRYREAGIRVVEFPLRSLVSYGALRQGWRIARWLKRERIQVLHTHDVYSNVFMVPWARLAGVPRVIASRRWWYTVPRKELVAANRIAYRLAHRVLANSESVARLLTEEEGLSQSKVFTVPNFVDEEAFRPLAPDLQRELRTRFGLVEGVRGIGIVARLDPVKRHCDLLKAFALLVQQVPRQLEMNMRLVIVGGGPERSTLERLAADLGVAECVCFAGPIAHTPALPSLFDVVALSSDSEGFPNAVVEAMAAARPVVATAVGGVVDAVEHGVTGLLVPPRSPAAMAEALRVVLTQPEQARRMGIAAQQRARERYHVLRVVPRLEQVYLSAVEAA